MSYVIGTAGHVDHGKSSLVQALTGIDPDRLEEEKRRQMTIDLGFAWLSLPLSGLVGVVDVPGHQDFIENMLAGVGGVDLALLVVAADDGPMPQTLEHAAIIELLGIPAAVVAINKVDAVDDSAWLHLIEAELRRVLTGPAFEAAPFVRVSARTGAGLEDLRAALDEALGRVPAQPVGIHPRLPIDRVFSLSGFGTVVTGTLTGGSLRTGDEVELLPSGRRARIRGLQQHQKAIDEAHAGSRVAVNLSGIEKTAVQRGDLLAPPGQVTLTVLVDAWFQAVGMLSRPLRHGDDVKCFCGAAEYQAVVRLVGVEAAGPGEQAWMQLRLSAPAPLERGARFILRWPSPAETIGGGTVLDAAPAHRWRRFKPETLARFETLLRGSPEDDLLRWLHQHPFSTAAELLQAYGQDDKAAAQSLAALLETGQIIRLRGEMLLTVEDQQALLARLRHSLRSFHQQHPLRAGLPREALRQAAQLPVKGFTALIEAASDELVPAGEHLLRLSEHQVRFTARQQAAIDAVLHQFAAAPLNTPLVKDVSAALGAEVYNALLEQGALVQLNAEVVMQPQIVETLTQQIVTHLHQRGTISAAEARDLIGTSRKYALALLEYLDARGITRRTGDARTLASPVEQRP